MTKLIKLKTQIALNTISTRFTTLFFAILGMHLLVASLFFQSSSLHAPSSNLFLFTFFFEFEKNIPTLFSSFILLSAGLLMSYLSRQKKEIDAKLGTFWKALGYVFIYLAADEWFSLHEILNQFGKYSFPSWLVFYVPLALVIGLLCVKPLFRVPSALRNQIILAGLLYSCGAVLFEFVNAKVGAFQFSDIRYQVILFLEDGLEMLGVLVLIRALISYLRKDYGMNTIAVPLYGLSILLVITVIESIVTYVLNLA